MMEWVAAGMGRRRHADAPRDAGGGWRWARARAGTPPHPQQLGVGGDGREKVPVRCNTYSAQCERLGVAAGAWGRLQL